MTYHEELRCIVALICFLLPRTIGQYLRTVGREVKRPFFFLVSFFFFRGQYI